MKKNNIILGIVVVVIIVGAGLLGITAGGFFSKTKVVANGIVIDEDNGEKVSALITTYTEYTDLLNEYDVNDVVLLTNNSFDDYDYIVDYMYYEDGLDITDIDIEATDDGLIITYEVNKEVTESDEYLMYFIPIEKGTFSDVTIKSRSFNVK